MEPDTMFLVDMLNLPTPTHLHQEDLYAPLDYMSFARLWHHAGSQVVQHYSQ
jgi:hypothetical protein